MAKVSVSELVANLGIDLDNKSIKKITKGFKDLEKYYQNLLKNMDKGDKKREKDTKKSIGKTLNEFQSMFRKIQKDSDSIDFSNMATGLNALTEIASKTTGWFNETNKRIKELMDSDKSLEDFDYSTRISVESVQFSQEAGKGFHLGEGDIRSFISSMN